MKPNYQVKQDFMNAIKNGTIHKLKHDYKQNTRNWAFDGIRDLVFSNKMYSKCIVGELTPKDIGELGDSYRKFCRPKNFITEALWVVEEIKLCKSKISKFVILRRKVEQKILLGEYQTARKLIKNIQDELGVSVWSLENTLLTYCLENDYSSAFAYITKVNEENSKVKSGFVKFLIHWLYKRSNTKIFPIKYDLDLHSFEKRNQSSFDEDRYNYFLFRLNYYEHPYFDNMSAFPIMESPNSIYDRYINLCKLIQSYFCFGTFDEREIAVNSAVSLYRIIGDSRLLNYVIIRDCKIPDSFYNSDFISLLDFYYSGNYTGSLELSKRLLQSNVISLDIIKIYCRSLLFQDMEYTIVGNIDSPLNQITHCIYDILEGNVSRVSDLERILKNLYEFDIAADLDYFIRKERTGEDLHFRIKLINTFCYDPIFVYLLDNESDKINYLDYGLAKNPNALSISYQKGRIKKDVSKFNVVSYIKDLDLAKICFDCSDFEGCIKIMYNLKSSYSSCSPVVQTAVQYIFESLFNLEQYKQAYTFFIDTYLESPAYISKTKATLLIDHFHECRFKNERLTLKYLLFILINSDRPTDKSFVLENYLRYKDFSTPSQLLEQLSDIEIPVMEVLFYHVLSDDILRHLMGIRSTRDLLDEKKAIVNILLPRCVILKDYYESEKHKIDEELDAYGASINDDESKIYANVPAIIKYEGEKIRPLFDQLQTLYNVSGSKFLLVDGLGTTNQTIVPIDSLEQPVEMTENILSEISVQIFEAIKQPFLKSKFGVGTYLSTRIRHGVFEGELRSFLVKAHLALTMENGKYVPDNYWRNSYNLSDEVNTALIQELEAFSKFIDGQINYFKKNVIQIKLKQEEYGYLDFSDIPEDEIFQSVVSSYMLSVNSKNQFEDFIKRVIDSLWGMTEKCLARIRDNFDNDFIQNISEHLMTLNDMQIKSNERFYTDFKECINTAHLNLEHKRVKIGYWFHIQDVRIENYKLIDFINLTWATCKRYHPAQFANLKKNGNANLNQILLGSTRIHLSDVFRIVFTNMFLYSKRNIVLDFLLTINEDDDDNLIFQFSNEIDCNEDELNTRLGLLINSSENLQKEGGTGLVKIQKIIKYDFGFESNHIDVKAENGIFTTAITINMTSLRYEK
ncbi:MAG: hypothetical protein NC453_21545 [Muribaculum sp.]|nr:hypothetical protein [Muribaculum sp.]